MKQLLKTYLKDIADTIKRVDAREETYYGFLANLLEAFPFQDGEISYNPIKYSTV
jgi:hypothetical protein